MISIGDFAKQTELTNRALRYYEQKGILIPFKVDEFSGYRYYDESQIDDARVVIILKEVGFSIKDIQDILANNADNYYLAEQLLKRKTRAIAEVNEARYRLNLIIDILLKFEQSEEDLLEVLKMDLLDKHLDHYQKSFFEMANEKTREAIARKIEMAGIVIDIDSFKTINDTYGFEIGDIVLREIKNVVSSIEVDANCEYVVERYGGDEFRILMQGSLEEAKSLADEINRSVASIDYSMYVDDLTTTVTLGVAMLESDKGAATMFAHATTAMYQGKDSGGNNITIYK